MELFYHSLATEINVELEFDAQEAQHLAKVLRKKIGDTIWVTNGQGNLLKCEITFQNHKSCRFIGQEKQIIPQNKDYFLSVVIAPTKNMDRLEWFVEKATEIGIDEIMLILCEHSERRIIKTDRLEKISMAALKQSQQFFLPQISKLTTFQEALNMSFNGKRLIAHCVDNEKKSIKNTLNKSENVQIWIGPEGDFSENEINNALLQGCIPITLGKTRLRTETAGIVAVQSVVMVNE